MLTEYLRRPWKLCIRNRTVDRKTGPGRFQGGPTKFLIKKTNQDQFKKESANYLYIFLTKTK